MILENKQRGSVALLVFVLLTLCLFASGAQLREQKHVTAIQLGGAAEGSRVTVVSLVNVKGIEGLERGIASGCGVDLAHGAKGAAGPRRWQAAVHHALSPSFRTGG